MKALKMYLIIMSTLLVIAIGFGIYIWYNVQKFDYEMKNPKSVEEGIEIVVPEEVNPE